MSVTGPYGVILADPPWSYSHGKASGRHGVAERHYETMSDEDIMALRVNDEPVQALAAKNSVLLLWATWPKLHHALHVLESWGFEYVTGLPWVKIKGEPSVDLWGDLNVTPGWGVGFWFRGVTEPLLVGRRGQAKAPRDANMLGLLGPRLEHSRKPASVHAVAEHMPGPHLELFARRPREGWDTWGNEV